MAFVEALTDLDAQPAATIEVAEVPFIFEGLPFSIASIDLTSPDLQHVAEEVSRVPRDTLHPQQGLVIFDNKQEPRLLIVHGMRERWEHDGPLGLGAKRKRYLGNIPYLSLLRLNPDDDKIFVQGERTLHPFEDRGGRGVDLESQLIPHHRNCVVITNDERGLVVEVRYK